MVTVITKESFSKKVIDLVSSKEMEFIEAIIILAEEAKIELEQVNKLLTPIIKEALEIESRDKKLLKTKVTPLTLS